MLNDASFSPLPMTYRILIKGLVEIKEFSPDLITYHYLMGGCVQIGDGDGVFRLFEEHKGKLGGGFVEDGVAYRNLMKRGRANSITSISDSLRVCSTPIGIKEAAIRYFSSLYSEPVLCRPSIGNIPFPKLFPGIADLLEIPCSEAEIKVAIWF
ncbi:hypothetical protein Tsubulata_019178 [Turnera subulata]|uniref:Uncharacterized protein n=1 Tax=Turnera subulata TaxID=218843 RepID=A0A9Q0JLS6_9ROSI|nr:hypothetical protein Tsubulata_019178 [Turnera subulata]